MHYYYYYQIIQKTGDKEKGIGGRWTDVLKKQGDKWVLIADHGGAAPSKD